MSGVALSEHDVGKLQRFASVLIPENAGLPAAGDLPAFARTIKVAVRACGFADQDVGAAVQGVPEHSSWEDARRFGDSDPARFRLAGMLVSAAYFMIPEVLDTLGYPADRQQPAGAEDFVEEYETGITDAVSATGPRYRGAA